MIRDLAGIIPPLTTPFDSEGRVDLDGLRRNIGRYQEAGLGGYLVFGSSGEAVHLDSDERARALEVVRSAAGDACPVIAGVNAQSTAAAIAEVRRAAAAGADFALVITPYFYQGAMSQEVLAGFFGEVAEAAPLPILVYNIPQNTGVRVSPATLARLAEHPRIVGTKDSSGDFAVLGETLRRVPAAFRVFVGSAAILHPALVAGAAGGILALACALPEACVELASRVAAGDHEQARELQAQLAPIGRLLTGDLGIAGLKAAVDAVGLAGGSPRPPLRPLALADQQRVNDALAPYSEDRKRPLAVGLPAE